MNLDDMKTSWRELEQKVVATQAAVAELRVERALGRTQSALRPLAGSLVFELAQDLLAAFLLAAFLLAQFNEPRFSIPAAALLGLAMLSTVSAVRQLAMIQRINFADPVSVAQRMLAELRCLRVRTFRCVLLTAPFIWAPLLIVAARGLLGLDIYAVLGWRWILANFVFGATFFIAAGWAVLYLAHRFNGSWWVSAMADGLAGRSLSRAIAEAREVATFVEEPDLGRLPKQDLPTNHT